jgi:two-component system, LuxR family, response regulator FixJ
MADSRGAIVAVVDNDHAERDAIRLLLEAGGHCVETFGSAAEVLKAEVKRFACLLLDHHMPHMTGLELAAQLRADGVAVPIVLMTGLPTAAIIAQAAALEVERVLEKPMDGEDLLAIIGAVQDR